MMNYNETKINQQVDYRCSKEIIMDDTIILIIFYSVQMHKKSDVLVDIFEEIIVDFKFANEVFICIDLMKLLFVMRQEKVISLLFFV